MSHTSDAMIDRINVMEETLKSYLPAFQVLVLGLEGFHLIDPIEGSLLRFERGDAALTYHTLDKTWQGESRRHPSLVFPSTGTLEETLQLLTVMNKFEDISNRGK